MSSALCCPSGDAIKYNQDAKHVKYSYTRRPTHQLHVCLKLKREKEPKAGQWSEWTIVVERGGALVESMPFDRRVVDSNPALAPRRDLEQVHRSLLPVALRRETPAQYPCCVGSAPE